MTGLEGWIIMICFAVLLALAIFVLVGAVDDINSFWDSNHLPKNPQPVPTAVPYTAR